ncbi:tRNA (guanine(26)-N(2))-dimethyltransferase like protein [Argiope bruennichi]|uniref:tRNA (guanine(26)-N(2))-dimethyltransferase n=1 Tax=Argiope bruennichi TaxID=94029 RepID=A0A8T0ES91_ARGBR|nr:tRNA (guanine(26)-N(2))-dimethyltransferase like protein [Argiope bruennichi]
MTESVISVERNKELESVDNLIYIDKTPFTAVTEGKAEVLFPSSHDVFYNPVQEFNRDLSIAVLKQFARDPPKTKSKAKLANSSENSDTPGISVLEALSASGLRAIRFAKEVPNLSKVIANDRDTQAYLSIQRNVKHNKVENIVQATNEDASLIMYKNRSYKDRFDAIDLDPYGTAAPFLDAAVQSVKDGGLLMITCTDMAILCGNGVEACHAKYGAVSAKIGSCHEMALRILLQSIESHANRYGRYIVPLLSLSVDFYVRVFVQVFTSPATVKESICKLSMVFVCSGCGSFYLQPVGTKTITPHGQKYTPSVGPPIDRKCSICGHSSFKMCGPIWSHKLHDKVFIQKTVQHIEEESSLYNTSKRMVGMLNVVLEELEDFPLFHRIEQLSSILHVKAPSSNEIRSAVLNAGYQVSLSHTSPTSLKTDSPPEVIWDIMRAWANMYPGKKTFELEPSKTIMSKESSIEVSFKLHPDAEPKSRCNNLLRFQINPAPNWGPKCRATTSVNNDKLEKTRSKQKSKRKEKAEENHKENVKRMKGEENDEISSENCK